MNSSDNRSPQQIIWSLGDQLDSDIWRLPCLLFLWVEKCLFQWEILSARGKMDTNTSEIFCLVWGQPVDEMKKKLKLQPQTGSREGKNGAFFQAENVTKISEIFFGVILCLKKNLISWWKRPKLTLFYLNFKNVIDFLSPPNSIPACISRQKTYVQATPMSCFFPGKDEPNARSPVQARARRGSCLRKRSLVLRNVVILITTNPENDIQKSF